MKLLEAAHKKDVGHHWAFGTDGWKDIADKKLPPVKVFEDADCGFRQVQLLYLCPASPHCYCCCCALLPMRLQPILVPEWFAHRPLQIGDLSSDKKFMDALWSEICRKSGLPNGASREGFENLDGRQVGLLDALTSGHQAQMTDRNASREQPTLKHTPLLPSCTRINALHFGVFAGCMTHGRKARSSSRRRPRRFRNRRSRTTSSTPSSQTTTTNPIAQVCCNAGGWRCALMSCLL